MCKQASNKLNALARVAKYLDHNKRKLLMNSFVISNLIIAQLSGCIVSVNLIL